MSKVYKKIFFIIGRENKKHLIMLILMTIIGTFLELIGIAFIIPVMQVVLDPDIVLMHPYLNDYYPNLSSYSYGEVVFLTIMILLLIYFTKSVYLTTLIWKQIDFVFKIQERISKKLYEIHLSQSYISFLNKNSSNMIQNIINDTLVLSEKALLPVIMLISEIFVLVGVLIILVLMNPFGSISVILLFGLLSYIFHAQTKKNIYSWGQQRQMSDARRIKTLQESFSEFKFCNMTKSVEFFVNKYSIHNKLSANSTKKQTAFQQFPRIWLELVAVIAVCMFLSIMIMQEKDQSQILSSIALFAVASFRTLPSINRTLSSIQSIKFSQSIINVIYQELKHQEERLVNNNEGVSLATQIEMVDVKYTYPGKDYNAINNLNLTIPKNRTIGIIGESGSGKSTLISLLMGLLKPDVGKILIDDKDINHKLNGWKSIIGYVPQEIHILDDSLRRNIAFGVNDDQINEERLNEVIRYSHLNSVLEKMTDGLDTILGESGAQLSGGQRQRIGIARALYREPEILILDEATSALDNAIESHILRFIPELNKKMTIIMVTHRLDALKVCDTVVRLQDGSVVKNVREGL